MTNPILAWHGNPALKAEAVERMKRHRDADMFIQGNYCEPTEDGDPRPFRGCFHGCLTVEALAAEQSVPIREVDFYAGITEADRDRLYDAFPIVGWAPDWFHGERLWGIPIEVAALLDDLFEQPALTLRETADWAVAATEAIPVGADLSGVASAFSEARENVRCGEERALMLRLLAAAPVVTR